MQMTFTYENPNNARDVKSSGFISNTKAYPNNDIVNQKRLTHTISNVILVNEHFIYSYNVKQKRTPHSHTHIHTHHKYKGGKNSLQYYRGTPYIH